MVVPNIGAVGTEHLGFWIYLDVFGLCWVFTIARTFFSSCGEWSTLVVPNELLITVASLVEQ